MRESSRVRRPPRRPQAIIQPRVGRELDSTRGERRTREGLSHAWSTPRLSLLMVALGALLIGALPADGASEVVRASRRAHLPTAPFSHCLASLTT